MVRPSWQSAPEPPALVRPPVSEHDARLLARFLRPVTLTFDLFAQKMAFHVLVPWGTCTPILISVRMVTDRQTERNRRTDGQDAFMQPTGQPHKKNDVV